MFESCCDKYGKLFVPEPRQEAIVENLVKHYEKFYDAEILMATIDTYVKLNIEDAILIFDFALKSAVYREKAIEEREDREAIQKLMQETRKRMEGFK